MRILIVDDELPIRRGIAAFLIRQLPGGHDIRMTGSGKETLETIDKGWPPDVMLTDVLMPGMDGLELARRARSLLPELRIIMVSGSSEFAHVKASIQCEADDYLLKPVLPAELLRVVTATLARAETQRRHSENITNQRKLLNEMLPQMRTALLVGLLSHSWQDRAHFTAQLGRVGLSEFVQGALALAVFWMYPDREARQLSPQLVMQCAQFAVPEHHHCVQVDEHTVALVWPLGNSEGRDITQNDIDATLRALAAAGSPPVYGGICQPIHGAQALREGYRTALAAAHRQALADIDPGAGGTPAKPILEIPIAQKRALRDALIEGNPIEYTHAVEACFASVLDEAGPLSPHQQAVIVLTWKDLCEWLSEELDLEDVDRPAISPVGEHVSALRAWLLSSVNALNEGLARQHGNRAQRLVKYMRHMARTHYDHPLSIKTFAAEINASPNYLSTLFKQEKGVSFVEYLTNIRIKRALELLDDSNMKVNDIARLVGYEDPNYFTRVFRKQHGMTPSEYRERT